MIALSVWLIPAREISVIIAAQAPIIPNPIVQRLITCESGGRNVSIVDSNGKMSYGILQFQMDTWRAWARASGIVGHPMVEQDAIRLANWAVGQPGLLRHWTCAKILGMV